MAQPHLKKNQTLILTISGMTSDGMGVGRHEGFALFVPGCIVGEFVRIKIVKLLKNYGYGLLLEILSPSSSRVEPDCTVYRSCGGCCYRHLSYQEECRMKEETVRANFQKIAQYTDALEPILPSPSIEGYRNKAQYPLIKLSDGSVAAGFYAKNSHRVIPSDGCKLQPEIFSQIMRECCTLLTQYDIPLYNEEEHSGLMRHLYLRIGQKTGEVMLCFVVNGDTLPHQEEIVSALRARFSCLTSIILNKNTAHTNVILGRACKTLAGTPFIHDEICSIRVRISPLSFYQVNRDSAEKLYLLAAEFAELKKSDILLDLYCGTGTIGLTMAAQVNMLIGVEIIGQAIEDAKRNAALNGIKNARFLCADAAGAAKQLAAEGVRPDVVVLDPPRKGCDRSVLETVGEMSPERIVMISCNSATAARDCAVLEELGYRLDRLRPVDLFPRTAHVESICRFTRK